MTLYVFDCDGTLWKSSGPVTEEMLDQLLRQGHNVAIVSESGNCADLKYPRAVVGVNGSANIMHAMFMYPGQPTIYVSDNAGDDQRAKQLGIGFVHPKDLRVPET